MKTFTSGAVSQELDLPPSTLRRYTAQFKEHLSETATARRGRRYVQSDLVILARARTLLRSGHSPEKTNELLAMPDAQDREEIKSLITREQVELLMATLQEDVRDYRIELDSLRAANDELQARLEYLEKPWWEKVLRRKEE